MKCPTCGENIEKLRVGFTVVSDKRFLMTVSPDMEGVHDMIGRDESVDVGSLGCFCPHCQVNLSRQFSKELTDKLVELATRFAVRKEEE